MSVSSQLKCLLCIRGRHLPAKAHRRIRSSERLIRVSILSAILVSCLSSFGQTVVTTGAIRGLVADPTGAMIANATVDAIHQQTGVSSSRRSNREGLFAFPELPIGRYSIRVSAPGFQTAEMKDVSVTVGQIAPASFALHPGAATQVMVVTAKTPTLRTTDSTLSTIIDRENLNNLPLSGRRYTDFALLTPNSTPDGEAGLVSFAGEQGGEDAGYANGNGANSFTLDGANATSNYFGNARGGERVPYVFGENAIQEFQVAVSPYSAAYGGGATGFLNTVTKSGADDFHGNAFYYNRNSGTGANDAISKANGIPRPVDILQQFGASVGGPLVKQKAWFFFDYEQQREKDPISVINDGFQGLTAADFGVPQGTLLPAPTATLPSPTSLTLADVTLNPSNPIYLQQVSNALNAINTNIGTHSRYRNDLALFTKVDYQASSKDRLYLSLNLNRFDSPNGEITNTQTALFGISTLANSYVRDYHASLGWTHAFSATLLSDTHASFSRDDQYSTPTGYVSPSLPSILISAGGGDDETGLLQIGNAGFAGGRTNEAQWELAQRFDYLHGRHNFKFGVEGNRTHVTDSAFGGFDPDAARQNGTLGGTYFFSSLVKFAIGNYDTFSQASGNPNFTFDVPYIGFYAQDTWQIRSRLTLDFGVREDFQIYPQPTENPAFPLTGQFPNRYQRLAPRFGFAWQPAEKTVVRGGFGVFYENFNGLNYRNSVISNGLPSQQATASTVFNPALPPNQQSASIGPDGTKYGPAFPNAITNSSFFAGSPDISLVDPNFHDPYILQSSLQIEREILPETTLSLGTMWTHGVHLISSSAYDMNLIPPTGVTNYFVCPANVQAPLDAACSGGRTFTAPTLDSGLLQEGRINANLGQINALISPGINNYNSFFVQLQRRFERGLALQTAYTFAHNNMSNGVDFSNQFDFSNTRGHYLIDQRHRLTVAAVYEPFASHHFESGFARGALSNWTVSTVMQFASGRPYAALLDTACTSSQNDPNNCDGAGSNINDSAANQSTANSALGINGSGPSPTVGLNSFFGPWTQQVDLGLARRIPITERQQITLQVQAFNLLNHANYYVQNGNGVNAIQYTPVGKTCGDAASNNQTCYLLPNAGPGGFQTLQIINALNGPRVLQFAFKWSF
jgi:Carboxypeptidase regulatory-like domain/TonB dependent receptor